MAENLINLKDPDTGEIGSLPASQVPQALQQGFTQAAPEEVDNFFKQEKYGTFGQQVKAAAEGLAEGVAGPIATGAEVGLGIAKPEDIRARKEVNPGVRGSFEIGGFAGSLLLGTGEAQLLEQAGIKGAAAVGLRAEEIGHEAYSAARAAGATVKAASAAKEAALAGEGITGIGKIGSGAVRAATEMALYQAGDEVSKKILNDPEQTLGSAMADVRNAGLLGLIGGGALSSVSPLWEATVGKKMTPFIEDFKSRVRQHLDNPDPHGAMLGELGTFVKSTGAAADEVYGSEGLKAQAIQKHLPEMGPKISEQVNQLNEKLGTAVNKLKNDANFELLRDEVDKFQAAVTHPDAGPAQIFDAVENLKKQLQEYGRYNKDLHPLSERAFRTTVKELAYDARSALEDSGVWGKAADAQKKLNSAFSEYLPALKDFQSTFMTKVGGEHAMDPGKIQTYVGQAGKPLQAIKQTKLGNYLEAAEKYRNAIGQTYESLGVANPIEEASLNHTKQSLEKLSPGAKLADVFVKKAAAKMLGEGAGAVVGGVLGHSVGAGAIGALIGEHALGPFFSSVLPGIVKPLLEKEASSTGFKGALEYGVSAARGDSAMNRAARGVFKGGTRAALPTTADVKKLDKKLMALKEDPSPLLEAGGGVGHYLPDHAVAIGRTTAQAVNYLNGLRPNVDKPMPFDSEMPPDPVKQAQFERALEVAQNPLTVMEDVKDGSVTVNDLATLQNVAPGFYSAMRDKLNNEIINYTSEEEEIPYRTKLGLAIFLGQPMDSTMTPMGIQMAQPQMPPEPQQMAGKKPTQGGMQKMAKMGAESATTDQSREMGRAKHIS